MKHDIERVCRKLRLDRAVICNVQGVYDLAVCRKGRCPQPRYCAAAAICISTKLLGVKVSTAQFAARTLLSGSVTTRVMAELELLVLSLVNYSPVCVPEALGMREMCEERLLVSVKRSPRSSTAMDSDGDSDSEVQAVITRSMDDVARGLVSDYEDRKAAFLKRFHEQSADTLAIRNMEQRGNAWKMARSHRITGSVAGSWMQYNPYCSLRSAIKQRLYSKSLPPNAHMQRGVRLEPIAVQLFTEKLQAENPGAEIEVTEAGLCVMDEPEYHCFGYSPDMIIRVNGVYYLGEIKAPNGKFYASTPLMYRAQMQMGMWMLRSIFGVPDQFQSCHFVQILEHSDGSHELKCQVEPYDAQFTEHMMRELKRLWEVEYVPRVILKDAGLLKDPYIDVTVDCDPKTPLTVAGLSMYKNVGINKMVSVRALSIGASGIGKTEMLHTMSRCERVYGCVKTIGVDFVSINTDMLKVQVWDAGGHTDYQGMLNPFKRNVEVTLLCYSDGDIASFEWAQNKHIDGKFIVINLSTRNMPVASSLMYPPTASGASHTRPTTGSRRVPSYWRCFSRQQPGRSAARVRSYDGLCIQMKLRLVRIHSGRGRRAPRLHHAPQPVCVGAYPAVHPGCARPKPHLTNGADVHLPAVRDGVEPPALLAAKRVAHGPAVAAPRIAAQVVHLPGARVRQQQRPHRRQLEQRKLQHSSACFGVCFGLTQL